MVRQAIAPWYIKLGDVFEQEKAILLRHGFVLDEELLAAEQQVVFRGCLPVEADRELVVRFVEGFPSFAPRVFDTGSKPLLRRHHQPTTRQLCLFGPGSVRWHAGLTCEDVLREAANLLSTFAEGAAAVEDTVPEPASAVLPYRPGISILVPPPISDLPTGPGEPSGTFVIRCDHISKNADVFSQGIVFSASIGSRLLQAGDYYRRLFQGRGDVSTGRIVFLGEMNSGEALVTEMERVLRRSTWKKNQWFGFTFLEQSGTADGRRLGWVFGRSVGESKHELFETFAYREDERRARIPTLISMMEKTVAMIGCGCLGSKIAAALAASGATRFALIDHETMEPNNSVRHEVGVRYFGQRKVTALGQRLTDLNPDIEVQSLPFQVGGSNKRESDKIIRAIEDSDVVVDTTGAHAVSRWTNEQCFIARRPCIFVSVTNGAWAGEIVRVVPKETACWLCWNDQYADDPPPGASSAGIFAPGCGQPSFTGSTFDAGIVADLGSAMIAATLCRLDEHSTDIDGDYVRWIGCDAGGSYVLRADVLDVRKRHGCVLCDAT